MSQESLEDRICELEKQVDRLQSVLVSVESVLQEVIDYDSGGFMNHMNKLSHDLWS